MTNENAVKAELEKTPQRVRLELDKIRNDGIFIQVHVGGASLMTRQTTLAERGLISGDIRRELQTAGVTLTVPRAFYSKFHSIENKVRANCDRLSYDLNGFKPWRFLTWDMAAMWYENHQKYVAQAVTLCDDLVKILPEWETTVRVKFTAAASSAWNSLAANAQKRGDRAFEMFGAEWNIRSTRDAEAFVAKVVALAVAQIPTESAIRANMRVTFDVAIAQLGSEIQAELAQYDVESIRRSQARKEATEARIAADDAERERNERRIAAEYRAAAVKAAVAAQIREQLADLTSPYEDAINGLRSKMAGYARRALAAINKSGKVSGQTAASLRNMVDLYDAMKLGTDDELAALMSNIKIASPTNLAQPGNLPELLGRLADIPLKAATVAEAYADSVKLVSAIEIDDDDEQRPTLTPAQQRAQDRAVAGVAKAMGVTNRKPRASAKKRAESIDALEME